MRPLVKYHVIYLHRMEYRISEMCKVQLVLATGNETVPNRGNEKVVNNTIMEAETVLDNLNKSEAI